MEKIKIYSFKEALGKVDKTKLPHLLLGNGFSQACKKDIFSYKALFEQADFKGLSPFVKKIFKILNTTDFEEIIKAMQNSYKLFKLYYPKNRKEAKQILNDAESLKELLVTTIAKNHPERPTDINEKSYACCRNFLKNFHRIYTLNYDLLLYWAIMHEELPPKLEIDDGFRAPENEEADYVTWEIEKTFKQNLFYLHGALHIFDAGYELQKYTWINTQIRLIEQIRSALKNNYFPLFVSEGTSNKKLEKINHSNYLSRGLRSISSIEGSLFIYGHSLSDNDDHILQRIGRGKISKLFISIYGNPQNKKNQNIIRKAESLKAERTSGNPIEVYFYKAESANVWGNYDR